MNMSLASVKAPLLMIHPLPKTAPHDLNHAFRTLHGLLTKSLDRLRYLSNQYTHELLMQKACRHSWGVHNPPYTNRTAHWLAKPAQVCFGTCHQILHAGMRQPKAALRSVPARPKLDLQRALRQCQTCVAPLPMARRVNCISATSHTCPISARPLDTSVVCKLTL